VKFGEILAKLVEFKLEKKIPKKIFNFFVKKGQKNSRKKNKK
jgi:hypothetical protein